MRHLLKPLGVLLLLIVAQQGALAHEFSHFSGWNGTAIQVDAGPAADAACALCPLFAQAATPAFGRSLTLPHLDRVSPLLQSAPQHSTIDATVPRARSRGPPSSN
jgi:hypothetical protein